MLVKKKGWGRFLAIALVFTFLFQCVGMILPEPASAATTELTITKYAVDGKTILKQRTVDYHWLKNPDNIPVMGDGETHYYHQGPVFKDDSDPDEQERLRWNEEEDQNWDTKDMGALKGTNVKDLCKLVGDMSEGDSLQVKSTDGFKKTFAYKNVYQYDPDREGPMVVCWYKDGKYPDTGYTDGMRLVWFAGATPKEGPTSIVGLPSGNYHVFGNWDWHEAADSQYWYYYSGEYPTTTGLSAQVVCELNIYSNEPVPVASPVLTADTSDNIVGQDIDIIFTDDADWRAAITGITVDDSDLADTQYTVTEGNINIAADVFNPAGDYVIVVQATGYEDATVTQNIETASPIALTIDGNVVGTPISYTLAELQAMPVSSVVNGGKTYTGVTVDYLLSTLGTVEDDWEVTIKIKDSANPIDVSGYSDPILAYERDGELFDDASGGETTYLRLATESTNLKYVYWMTVSEAASVQVPSAAFTVDKTSGIAPLSVQFTDQSANEPTSWAWDFDNDGTVDSAEQNPAYTFDTAGTYTVKLTVTNSAGSDEETKTDYITVTEAGPHTWYVDASGNADFSNISAAVAAANPGDTIIVKDGTYNENIVVDKSLVIESENGAAQTIVQAAMANADVFKVTAANVTIDGFTVSGATSTSRSGIAIFGSSSVSCVVINNKCSGNDRGIAIEASAKDNTVSNNICTLSGSYGIFMTNTTGNSITDNTCSNNPGASDYSGYGLCLFDDANNNNISGNISDLNREGIRVKNARTNSIYNNTFSNNNIGVNVVYDGIENVIYLNNFVDNATEIAWGAFGTVTGNFWNSPTEMTYSFKGTQYNGFAGNYWSGYSGADADGNGIGDTPYQTVKTDNDNYPLIGPWQDGVITAPPVAVTSVSISEGDQELELGQTVQLNAIVLPEDASNKNISWSSNDEAIATVSEKGLVTAVAVGSASITVTTEDGNFSDSITINSLPVEPQISLYCNSGIPGASVFMAGRGFDAEVAGTIWFDTNDDGILDQDESSIAVVTDQHGTIPLLTSISVPTVDTGDYSVRADIGDSKVSVTFNVTDTGIIVSPISGNSQAVDPRYITVTGTGLSASASYRLFVDRNGNGIFDDGAYKSSTTAADGTINISNLSWPSSPTGIYNILLDIDKDGTIEAAASVGVVPGLKITTPRGVPGTNIGMTLVGFSANADGYVWFDANGNGVWDEDENRATLTTTTAGGASSPGLSVPSISPGNYQVRTAIPACGLNASASYGITGIVLNTDSGTAGTSLDIAGFGLVANQKDKYVWFDANDNGTWDEDEIKVDVSTDANGNLSLVSLTVPEVPAGVYNVRTTAFPSGNYVAFTVQEPEPEIEILHDGTVALDPDETFTVTVGSNQYTIDQNTPLGALHAAALANGFTYVASDKKWKDNGILLLDDIGDYPYQKTGNRWFAYVNGIYKDGYDDAADGLNIIELADQATVEFYYVYKDTDKNNLQAVKDAATAAVKTVAATGVAPTDWTLQLSGAKDETLTKDYFEQGLACPSSGHQVSWTDDKGTPEDTSDDEVWGGVPLWLLVAMVDDNPNVGDSHINFNDGLAAAGYEVKVIAGDGWSTVLDSADIARSDAYIVANTLNGEPLPLKIGDKNKDCWPLYLKGSAISGGQQVGNIVRIELSGLPEPPAGWTLEMVGEIGDTITQQEFEEALACTGSGHLQEWTDNEGKVWSGVPLWVLLGAVDDIESGSHWTFDDTLAANYSVKVTNGDGTYSQTFAGSDLANSNNYIVANIYDGAPLAEGSAPLRLVGDGVTKDDGSLGGLAVGNIARIEILELQTPPAADGSWNLVLDGKISDVISQAEFEAGLACPNSGHLVNWTDVDGKIWSGIPLWYLAGWVDDRQPHAYDFNQAVAGYKVVVKASDGYSFDFDSADINQSSDYIIANKCNGLALTDSWPLRLVGAGVADTEGALTGKSVGEIAEIKLTSFESGSGIIPDLHIVKYGEDGVTIIDEVTINYLEMQQRFDVIGDGTTVYKYQGITNNADDIWSADNETVGGFKIENAIMGTRVSDLVGLVDGMGTGTDITFVAKDGWETTLPYSTIYPDPSVFARQGDAVIAWYADGKYVPDYKDGMRLFFTPEDKIYGQWDMHETLPEAYWHYYYGDVMYPSCAGLSPKYITEVKVYSVPSEDWTLSLDGQDIGGLVKDISKTYFESALTCTFGANHKASYTDSQNRTWEGMPLWLLVGFVDDQDQHSNNAFNESLAQAGYQVVITAADGHSMTIDSKDITRNHEYIVANSLNGITLLEDDDNWPLRLVGPSVSGSTSISQIVSIKLRINPLYTLLPLDDQESYTTDLTPDGINTMTVNHGISGFKYFTVNVQPVLPHSGDETVVFTHLRNGVQLGINASRADFDLVSSAQAGFNVKAGDVIKAYIVDELTNDSEVNPIVLQ